MLSLFIASCSTANKSKEFGNSVVRSPNSEVESQNNIDEVCEPHKSANENYLFSEGEKNYNDFTERLIKRTRNSCLLYTSDAADE